MVYLLFKFLHIIGAVVWLGGMVAVSVLTARIARERDGAILAAISRQSRFFGAAIVGPFAALTLIAGMVMLAVSRMGAPLWVMWGFAAILISIALGATLIRRVGNELSRLAGNANPDASRVRGLQQRLTMLNIINVIVLISAVAAMVFKPTL